MHIHFRDSHCCFQSVICQLTKVTGSLIRHVQSFYTQKDSSFIFQLFVSQVLFCDTVVFGAMDSSVPLSTLFLDVILMFFVSVDLVFMSLLGCSSQNITPV